MKNSYNIAIFSLALSFAAGCNTYTLRANNPVDDANPDDTGAVEEDDPPILDTGGPCPDPGYEKPGPLNTGPYDESLLEQSSGLTVTEDGAIIENIHTTGMIKVEANNVTIRNAIVDCQDSSWYGIQTFSDYTGTVIEHVEVINCKSAGIYGPNFHGKHLHIHEMWGDAVKARDNVTLEFSWIHHLGKNEGAHADGNQTRDGSNILLRGNFFDMPIPEGPNGPGSPYDSNATSINQAHLGNIDNLVMNGNWLNGGNYTVVFSSDPDKAEGDFALTNSALFNNRFGRDYRFGVLQIKGNVEDLDIACNRWDDTDELMEIND